MIRKANTSDIQILSETAARTFYETYVELIPENSDLLKAYTLEHLNPLKISSYLADPRVQYYVVEVNQSVAGYAKTVSGESVELDKFYVVKEWQGKGLGQQLLDFVKEEAMRKLTKKLWLSVYEKNLTAIAFYEKNGFVKTTQSFFIYQWNGEEYRDTNWIMELKG